MFWLVQWSDGGEDMSVVIEAETRAAAECTALKRDIPVIIVTEADPDDVRAARAAKRLWRYSADRGHRCFGATLSGFHVACLMIMGVLTAALNVGSAVAGTVPKLIPALW